VNESIRVPQVRLIDQNSAMVGVVPTFEAMNRAREAGLDLVEVSPTATPPVCKVLDFGKFQYELQKKEQVSRRKAHRVQSKEMRLSPKIGAHDLEIKVQRVKEFLDEGDRVQMNLRFRGARERAHPEEARGVMERVKVLLQHAAKVEMEPRMDGKNMIMILVPIKSSSGHAIVLKPPPVPAGKAAGQAASAAVGAAAPAGLAGQAASVAVSPAAPVAPGVLKAAPGAPVSMEKIAPAALVIAPKAAAAPSTEKTK
jgi:translation initiation factor IF-3